MEMTACQAERGRNMDNITLKIDPGSHDLVLADDALVMVS